MGLSRWRFCRQHSLRPYNESLCSSLRFNPDMCAERWARRLKHFQKYTWCPKSTNQPHINMTHSCQQHLVLPSRDLLLCQSLSGPQRTQGCLWQVPCTAFQASLGGEGRGRFNCSGVSCQGPCCPGELGPCLVSHPGLGRRTESGLPPQGLFVQCWIEPGRACLVGPGWSGQDGPGLEPD